MATYKSMTRTIELVDGYARARLGYLELFVYIDKFLPEGSKKENILHELTDNWDLAVHAFVRSC